MEPIAEMGAGREMDALVAEKVMGWAVVRADGKENWYERQVTRWPCLLLYPQGGWDLQWSESTTDNRQWSPSTCIRDAWEVFQTATLWLFSKRRRFLVALSGLIRTQNVPFPGGIEQVCVD